MDTIELKAETRTTKGNSPARALRRGGRVPAVLYGPGVTPSMLAIRARDLDTILKRGGLGRTVFNLFIDDGQSAKPVMIKELQANPVSRALLHVDLYEVSMDRKIRVNIPVVTTGKAVGVENGGVLQIIRRDLEVFCLPNEIPDVITIDISNMDIGDAVHVEEIPVAGNIEIPHDVNFTILTISAAKREVDAATEGEEGAVAEGAKEQAAEETSEE